MTTSQDSKTFLAGYFVALLKNEWVRAEPAGASMTKIE